MRPDVRGRLGSRSGRSACAAIARAAATIALCPASGRMPRGRPARGSAPRPSSTSARRSRSRRSARRGRTRSRSRRSACDMSTALAPFSACSSPVVNRISIPAGGVPSRTAAARPPRIVTTAALLSAPRIASWRFVSRPSSLTTSTGPSSGTVSMCAHRSTVGAPSGPGTRASRLPESEPVAARCRPPPPRCPGRGDPRSAPRATARSRPDGLSISQMRMNSARSRSRSSLDTAWITPRTLPLDRPALSLPARDAAVHHVDHLAPRPAACSRLAAIAARCPDAQITATGCPASSPSGSSWMSW